MKTLKFVLGKVLGGLFAIAAAVLFIGLWKLQMLPTTVVTLIGVLMVLLTALVIVLTWSGRGKVRMTLGIVLAVIGIAVMCVGSFYVWKAVSTLNDISAGDTETVQMGVYMRGDDDRELNAENAGQFQFGILTSMDRQATDSVVEKLNKELKAEIACKEYESPVELVDALLKSDTDAMIVNHAVLQLLEDIPGYSEKLDKIREVFAHSVEIKTENDANGGETVKPDYTSLKDSFAIYISGIDTRGGKVSVKGRSDVNIVAVVNPKTRQILLVNTPRDYYVEISSPQKSLDGKKDKLTHAGLGGPNASRETLSNLYGIDINYYFKVNFGGFKEIVDALDGISVNSEYSFSESVGGKKYSFTKGINQLNGEEALAFCRIRHAFASGDNQRGKNQMAVIKAVIDKAMSPKLLTNYTQILEAVAGSMEMTVPMNVIGDLVSRQLAEGGSWNVVSYSVTGSGGYEKSPAAGGASAYMMFPHQESVDKAKQLIMDLVDGKTVTP
ncbi:MAG: LCP family protein [Oscillospiraceae bacterium]|nr:LCP family protein [Oscillospiraceae bacterium]